MTGQERQQQIEAGQKALESLTKHIPATRETQAEYRAVVKALNAAARLSGLQDTLAAYEPIVQEVAEGGDLAANGSRLIRAGLRAEAAAALALNTDGETRCRGG